MPIDPKLVTVFLDDSPSGGKRGGLGPPLFAALACSSRTRAIAMNKMESGIPAELVSRIRSYLGNGGLVNPELMEHDKVRDLLMDCLAYLNTKKAAQDEILARKAAVEQLHNRLKSGETTLLYRQPVAVKRSAWRAGITAVKSRYHK